MNGDSTGRVPAETVVVTPGIVAGIGLRQEMQPQELMALLDATLVEARLGRADLKGLATLAHKAGHPALRAVAAQLGLPILALAEAALSQPVPNPSNRVAHHLGLSSVAEAAALFFGPLLIEKRRSANATCALAAHFPSYVPAMSSAANAVSTLSTSCAGP